MTNEGFKQVLEAAENGNAAAMFDVARAYMDSAVAAYTDDDRKTNFNLGLSWMQRAAAHGHADAQQELSAAFSGWYAAAERGGAEEMMTLGFAYLKGIGTEADYKQAVFWCKKACAAKGNLKNKILAKVSLAMAKAMRPARNFRELLEGAQKGNANLQYALGFAYLKGFGTEVNPRQAVFWFEKAAARKHKGALQTLAKVQAILAIGGNNFDPIAPMAKPLTAGRQILSGIVFSAVLSYLATGFDIGWLYPVAIFFNVSWMIYAAFFIVASLLMGIGRIIGFKGSQAVGKANMVYGCLYALFIIPVIGLSVHYIKGRKTENPVSIVLQNPFEAARQRFFVSKDSEPEIVAPVVTATVTGSAANIRSEPDSSKNNIIIQAKKGDTLTVTGPVEKGWLPVEIDGNPGYVSSELVKINDD